MGHEDVATRPGKPATWLASADDQLNSVRKKSSRADLDVTYTAAPAFRDGGRLTLLPKPLALGTLASGLALGFLAAVLVGVFRRASFA